MPILVKLHDDRERLKDAIKWWKKNGTNGDSVKTTSRSGRRPVLKKEKYDSACVVWENWHAIAEVVWSKIVDLPWWPSHICAITEKETANQLEELKLCAICRVGREDLHIVKKSDLRKFDNWDSGEDLSEYSKSIIEHLTEVRAKRSE